jgi:hypothetical protein
MREERRLRRNTGSEAAQVQARYLWSRKTSGFSVTKGRSARATASVTR